MYTAINYILKINKLFNMIILKRNYYLNNFFNALELIYIFIN